MILLDYKKLTVDEDHTGIVKIITATRIKDGKRVNGRHVPIRFPFKKLSMEEIETCILSARRPISEFYISYQLERKTPTREDYELHQLLDVCLQMLDTYDLYITLNAFVEKMKKEKKNGRRK